MHPRVGEYCFCPYRACFSYDKKNPGRCPGLLAVLSPLCYESVSFVAERALQAADVTFSLPPLEGTTGRVNISMADFRPRHIPRGACVRHRRRHR